MDLRGPAEISARFAMWFGDAAEFEVTEASLGVVGTRSYFAGASARAGAAGRRRRRSSSSTCSRPSESGSTRWTWSAPGSSRSRAQPGREHDGERRCPDPEV
jgi:hypothetical protein